MDQKPAVILGARYYQAFEYANKWHFNQVRKSTSLPYILHPMGVASLVLEAGGDEDQAIAALLHDVPEDCGGEVRLTEIRELFGTRVEQIVRDCSDTLVADRADKAPWRQRKQAHIDHVKTADFDTLLVVAADKLHNGRSIATDLDNFKSVVWDRFNAWDIDGNNERIAGSCASNVIWYYTGMCSALSARDVSQTLIKPLERVISQMKALS